MALVTRHREMISHGHHAFRDYVDPRFNTLFDRLLEIAVAGCRAGGMHFGLTHHDKGCVMWQNREFC
jgi:hypothetical protein